MIEQLVACLAGVATGYAVGLMPGIGVTVLMITLFTLLMKIPTILLLIFYVSCVSACQFGGSVTALAVGLPGETNSFPLLKMRKSIVENGQQSQALFMCAAGHLIGAIVTFSISIFLIDWIAANTGYLKTAALVTFCSIGILLCCIFSESRWYFILPSVVAAWMLSRIGTDFHSGTQFMTFGSTWLSGGLPTISVILGTYAMPTIIESMRSSAMTDCLKFDAHTPSARQVMCNSSSMLRGSVLGYFAGLIPYVGIDLSSYLAYYTEKWLGKPTIAQVAAAETATNAAGISVLLPLLIFGIAIQPSENVLLELTYNSGVILDWSVVKPMFLIIASWLIVANCVSFFLSWNLAAFVIANLSKIGKSLPWFLLLLCAYSVFSIGTTYGQGTYYLMVLAISTTVGWLFRKQDMLPFIFIYMLQDRLEPAIMRLYTLYS